MTRPGWIAYASGLALAGALGYAVPRGERSVERPPATCAPRPSALDEVALRAAVRAELANLPRGVLAAATATAASGPVPAPTAAPPPRPEATRALGDGHRLLDDALARRRWSSDDRASFRALMAQVDGDGRAELLGELVPAINDGRLEVATGGTPF
ncbi:MAG TPA: hypothetical protein VN947_22370 [Polyangia bacterium]|nr:hypothetical protein [Polyangia bacterium]